MEDFSLIILCRGQKHLLPLTLDTLKPQNGSFEVLLLDAEGTGRLDELAQRYPELKLRAENASGQTLGEMMNQGIRSARGKYIQFLEPGDRYISQHGLQFIGTLIQNEPHLVYANSLNRGLIASADMISAQSPWFLKSKIHEIGGFDRSLTSNPSTDLLCRLFLDPKTQATFCRRVLVDSSQSQSTPLPEMCKILYRHFGLRHTLKWVLFQNPSHILNRTATFLKEAFWRND